MVGVVSSTGWIYIGTRACRLQMHFLVQSVMLVPSCADGASCQGFPPMLQCRCRTCYACVARGLTPPSAGIPRDGSCSRLPTIHYARSIDKWPPRHRGLCVSTSTSQTRTIRQPCKRIQCSIPCHRAEPAGSAKPGSTSPLTRKPKPTPPE